MPSEEDQAMTTGNKHIKFGKVWPHSFRVTWVDAQADRL